MSSRCTKPNIISHKTLPNIWQGETMPLDNALRGYQVDEYVIGNQLESCGSEAVLYECSNSKDKKFIFKHYCREFTENEKEQHAELMVKLQRLSEKNKGIVAIQAWGEYDGRPYEVMPYYRLGSLRKKLAKRRFSEEEIKEKLLPQMIDILNAIHSDGIFHTDIKPDNIMIRNTRGDLVLIDFGIAIFSEDKGTLLVAEAGGTRGYRAPEFATDGAAMPEADYYSLGIMLFELICGYLPQRGALESLPRPDGMSKEMYKLLYYLTFSSVENRDDREIYANRWTYEDVKRWLENGYPEWPDPDELFNPPSPAPQKSEQDIAINIRYNNQNYCWMQDLIDALILDWDQAKEFIVRKNFNLADSFVSAAESDERLKPLCDNVRDLVEQSRKQKESADCTLFKFIYRFGKGIDAIHWKGVMYNNLNDLGEAIFRSVKDSGFENNLFIELLSRDLLGLYVQQKTDPSEEEREKIHALEMISSGGDEAYHLYMAAYVLVSGRGFRMDDGQSIPSPDVLKEYLALEGSRGNLRDFILLCKYFMNDSGKENTNLRAWIDHHGGRKGWSSSAKREAGSLPHIKEGKGISVFSKSQRNNSAVFGGLILGLLILVIAFSPIFVHIFTMYTGNAYFGYENLKTAFVICAVLLPVLPMVLARIICIPRSLTTNSAFKFVTVVCQILKYDALVAAAAVIVPYYVQPGVAGRWFGEIISAYTWLVYQIRELFHFDGTDALLWRLQEYLNVSVSWFVDAIRLAAVFLVYTIVVALLRRRRDW